jgi:predicted chitinase
MLEWHQRVRGEKPELTGRALYQQVIVRRLGLDVEAARGVLQRAREHARMVRWWPRHFRSRS